MNYKKHYDLLIFKRRKYPAIGVVEKHHIVPKSLGGLNTEDNIVHLTPREHYIAHLLLAYMYNGRMWYAVHMMANMNNPSQSRVTGAMYEAVRRKRNIEHKTNHPLKGAGHTEETKKLISIRTKEAMKTAKKSRGMRGKKLTQARKKEISDFFKGRARSEGEKLSIKLGQPNIKNVAITDPTGVVHTFVGLKDAADFTGQPRVNIGSFCRREATMSKGKYKGWSYKYE